MIQWPNPIVAYRAVALTLAVTVIGSHLHGESDLSANGWIIWLALLHVVATQLSVPWLPRQSDIINAMAIAVDVGLCVLLLTMTHGWQGPFWLYAISAVFWPSVRFSVLGATASVIVFEATVLAANPDRSWATVDDGFAGDLAARGLMVLFVAGAIALTARAMAKVQAMATETERNRIARDLHDGVGKTMGGISLEARSLAQWVERDQVEASRRARYVARISERAANEVRDVIRGLRQSKSTAPLLPAVRVTVEDWQSILGIPIQFRALGQDAEIPVLIQGEILRMLEELLRNVAQHACAHEARVRLTLSTSGVTLSVRDDGRGFDPAAMEPWSGDGHFGLLGARERASTLGGHCRVKSALGKGTDVTVDIPLATRSERAFWIPDVFRMSERL
ncbi:MAG TPA: sensor histidine kinase [Thermomicrobiales bacterium]|nr:sensor histidine kinase [Thermomicrobiales bacterium]